MAIVFFIFKYPLLFVNSIIMINVSKSANIRNRYNQVPHLTEDTNEEVTSLQ